MSEKDKKKDTKKKNPLPPPNMYGSELERARDIKAGTTLDNADFDTKFKNADVKKSKEMLAKGGTVNENKMMKSKGRNMTKVAMQKEATKAVRKHEKTMHGAKSGSSVSKRADGIAQRGKTKGRMV